MADFYESEAGEPVAGVLRELSDVTLEEALAFPPDPARPSWMLTRFPVSMEEFHELNQAATQPEPAAAAVEVVEAQADAEAEVEAIEFPEDAMALAPVAAAPGVTSSFDGIPQTAFQPPDNTIAVGPSDVLLAVNADLAGYSKAGALRFRWANMTTLFRPVLPAGASLFDPRLAYDHYARRWLVVVAARRASPAGSWLMVAASQGASPSGPYWVWALDAALDGNRPSNNWADYPMLGFDTQAVYIALNMFQLNGGFAYTKLRILNKAELYAGGAPPGNAIRWADHWALSNPDNSLAFTVQPAVHFRGAGGNPPAYMANALWPGGTSLTLWTIRNPLGLWTGGAATLERVAVSCMRYDLPPDSQQPGSPVRIETNDARLLNAVYQYAGGAQRLWTCQTSRHTWAGDAEARAVVQWYEIDIVNRTITQQNRFGASGRYYFFPAIQTDISRNAYVVFSRAGATEAGQLRQSGRRVGDAPGALQNSALVQAGVAAYTGGRWGDYFGICRDGGDSGIVWMYGEYAGAANTWATRACAATFGP